MICKINSFYGTVSLTGGASEQLHVATPHRPANASHRSTVKNGSENLGMIDLSVHVFALEASTASPFIDFQGIGKVTYPDACFEAPICSES